MQFNIFFTKKTQKLFTTQFSVIVADVISTFVVQKQHSFEYKTIFSTAQINKSEYSQSQKLVQSVASCLLHNR